jgi:membrane protease YdiL (CAAX protease family)
MRNILGKTPAMDLGIAQLRKSLAESANPRKHLFVIPVLVELDRREEALKELNRLATKPENGNVAQDASLYLKLYDFGSASLAPEQQRKIEKYGWSGKLALCQDKSDSDPLRRNVLWTASKTVVVVVLFSVGIIAILATGFCLLICAIILRKHGKLRAEFSLPQCSAAPYLESFAIYISGMVAVPQMVRWLFPDYPIAASLVAVLMVGLAFCWLFMRGHKWHEIRSSLGLHKGAGLWREVGAGILGFLAGLPLLALAMIPVYVISRYSGKLPAHPLVNEIGRSPIILAIILALGCIWAPVVEEVFFRGMFYGYLRRSRQWVLAGISTAFLFAIIHPQGWMAVPVLGTIGFILSAIREWRGSLIASMTAHAVNNAAALLLAALILT